jgi:RNA polymerase sigma factor (sigma-70 family)
VSAVPSDSELIVLSLREPEAFAQLFDRHYGAIAGFLRRRLERSLADELAAETFLRAFAARDRYDRTRADARPWLFGIASNMVSGARRSEVRRWRALARDQQAAVADDELELVDARLDAAAVSHVLADALASLSAGDRDVLPLYAWAELKYEQIARYPGRDGAITPQPRPLRRAPKAPERSGLPTARDRRCRKGPQ